MIRTSLLLLLALFAATSTVDAFTSPVDVSLQQQQRDITSSITRPLKGANTNNNNNARQPTALYAAAKKKKSSGTKKAAKKKKSSSTPKEEVVNFKKAEFVSAIADKTGLSKTQSEQALSSILSIISEELAVGRKRISLPGFGTFKLSFRAARKGRNPKTGEEIDIRESYSPSFTASKNLKDMCNPDR